MPDAGLVIIGCGNIAAAHAAAARDADLPIVAVVDTDADRARELAGRSGAAAFPSLEALLEDADARRRIAAAVVCTPPSARLPLVERLLHEGIPTLVEKPLAHRHDDAEQLCRVALAHPRVPAAVGFCHRFTPAVLDMRRRVAAGQIGELVRFENVFACWHPRMRASWMSDPAFSGGGSLIDTACHSIDLFAFLVGSPRVEGVVLHRGWAGRGETNGTLLLSADLPGAEVAGVIASGWAEPARFRLSLVGTQGMLAYDYDEPQQLRFVGSDGRTDTIAVETHEVRFARQLAAFGEWAAGGSGRGELASFADALEVNRVIDEAYRRAAHTTREPAPRRVAAS